MVLPGDSEWKQEALRKALEGGYETAVVGGLPHAGLRHLGPQCPACSRLYWRGGRAGGATGTEAADEILFQASAERTAQGLRGGMVMGGVCWMD